MITRRQVLALGAVAALSGCAGRSGGGGGAPARSEPVSLVRANLPRKAASVPARAAAVTAVSAFSGDLFTAVAAAGGGNVVCSPYSVATALAMTVQGAKGTTARQMLGVLHADGAAALAEGLNGVDQALATRSGPVPNPYSRTGGTEPLLLASANSLWGQRGERWQPAFLDVLARDFGTGMRQVDYGQAEAARQAINGWVSQQTHARIPELIPPHVLDANTRLTLVNALYLKAPWLIPFEKGHTTKAPFHRLDGSTVSAHLMDSDQTAQSYGTGEGWTAATLPYAKGDLAMTVVLPDPGRFTAVRASLSGSGLARVLSGLAPARLHVALPRWTARTQVELRETLGHLGMPLAFTDAADLTGITTQDRLYIAAAVHEGYIAVDETGTEAAAATAVVGEASSAELPPTLSVVADRPFLYVIHDRPTGTPLFTGQVLDPTA